MDLTNQTMSNTNEICIQDSLNASLMKLKVKAGATTLAPSNNELIVYVDKQSSANPTAERKQYVFNLASPLKYCSEVGDELIQQFKMVDNKVEIETFVNRRVGTNEGGDYVLDSSINEDLDENIIVLFEGVNYIYTNYTNAEISVIYPKDNDITRLFLNNATYYQHLLNNDDNFTLDDIYFKDAFTKTNDKLNLEVNNACVECITSKNNKFSLDEQGNLTVNSITSTSNTSLGNETICNLIYPIGSIYLSVSNTEPSILFGGTWERINGYYLYAGTGGNTAGSNTSDGPSTNITGSTAITIDQMPSHTHTQNPHNHVQNANTWMNDPAHFDTRPAGSSGYYAGAGLVNYSTASTTATNNNTGGGQGHTHTLSSHKHNIEPLRYEVYMWKRTN